MHTYNFFYLREVINIECVNSYFYTFTGAFVGHVIIDYNGK